MSPCKRKVYDITPGGKLQGLFSNSPIFFSLYTSTARPALKNHRYRRLTATPAAWDRARL
jgi:hypothetical protein